MATEITMPKLSDTMTEGLLGTWKKSVGDRIERGDIIAEVETDKATMDLEAFTSGIFLEQRVQVGELVPVGTVIGLISEAGEAVVVPVVPGALITTPVTVETVTPSTPPVPETPVAAVEYSTTHDIQAAPVVRRRAAELGIDLATLQGSGPDGRVMLEDLEPLTRTPSQVVAVAEQPAPPSTTVKAQPLSRMRSAIARTTLNSWQSIPHFHVNRDIEMDRAEQVVQGLIGEGESVSLNALIMAAAASALTRFPVLNAEYGEAGIIRYPHVNLAFAVALADGLQMPVVKKAETKGVRELTAEVTRLTERARQGVLTADEISGGSFSVSNLGMYGVTSLASIIMPGQAAILALGSVEEQPIARNKQLAVARVMTATLSCDHRIIDGVTAAGFLNEFKRLLEHPTEMSA